MDRPPGGTVRCLTSGDGPNGQLPWLALGTEFSPQAFQLLLLSLRCIDRERDFRAVT